MNNHINTALVCLSDHSWQHREFDKRVERMTRLGYEMISINYDLMFILRRQPNPEHWFRIIEWKGWRVFLVNKNGLSLLRKRNAAYIALKPQADEAALADFMVAFIS